MGEEMSLRLRSLALLGTCVAALTQAGTNDARAEAVETVVVTAEKTGTAQDVQKVTNSITVTTHDQLVADHLVNLTQVGYRAPNVQLEPVAQAPGFANFSIRGMGLNTSTIGTDPTVGTVIDGVPIGNAAGAVVDTYDLQDVEILRGPQGVLFGRNTTSGAVLINSRRPTGDRNGEAEVSAGTHAQYGVAGAFEAPLVDDKLAFRIAAQFNHQGALYGNSFNPKAGGPKFETYMIRPTLRYTPASNLDITLIAERYHYIGTGEMPQSGGPSIDPSLPGGDTVLAVTTWGSTVCQFKDKLCLAEASSAHFTTDRLVGEINYHVGDGILTSITGYRNYGYESRDNDSDGTPVPVFHISPVNVFQHQWSQEVRYAGDAFDQRLNYVIGAFYFRQKIEQQSFRIIRTSPVASIRYQGQDAIQRQWSGAFFHNFTYNVTPELAATFGGRFTHEEKTNDIASFATDQCRGPLDTFDKASCIFDVKGAHFTSDTYGPQASLKYTPSDDVMLYAKYGIAYRSGGFNNANKLPTDGSVPYKDERVGAFEIGAKTAWLENRLIANLALFSNKYKNLQRAETISQGANGPGTFILNAASATIRGVEGELNALVTDEFQINGNFGYLDAHYDEFNGLDLTGDGIPDPALAKMLLLELAPKWTYSIGGRYTVATSFGVVSAGVNYTYKDSIVSDTTNSSVIGPVGLLDANISLTLENGQELTLYGQNLTDNIHSTQSVVSPPVLVLRNLGWPRTIGVTYRIAF
jgi:iron complex outermembrane receptor protein